MSSDEDVEEYLMFIDCDDVKALDLDPYDYWTNLKFGGLVQRTSQQQRNLVMKFYELVNRCHMEKLYNWDHSRDVTLIPYDNYFENIADLLHILKTPFEQQCVKLNIYLHFGVELYNAVDEKVYKTEHLMLDHILKHKGTYNKVFRDEIHGLHEQLKINALSFIRAEGYRLDWSLSRLSSCKLIQRFNCRIMRKVTLKIC